MTWTRTYTGRLAIAVDMLSCSMFWNKNSICVSSLCGLQLRRRVEGKGTNWLLLALADLLEWLSPGHCEESIQGDFYRMLADSQLMEYYIASDQTRWTISKAKLL
jgi:hypothetical protein